MTEALTNSSRFALADPVSALLLRAVSATGPEAVRAYREWRSKAARDTVSARAHRIMPLLVDMIQREGAEDRDLPRMKRVSQHIWTQSALNLRLLFVALDTLTAAAIEPVLLKGVALAARSPTLIGKRASGDVDILVRPEDVPAAANALRTRGFEPKGHHWDDIGHALADTTSSGIAMQFPGLAGELDFHWRPLWNIRHSGYTERLFARTDDLTLQGQAVCVPTVSDQLFLALARCEPWDGDESFSRLLEASLLLKHHLSEVDWPYVDALIEQYGLEAPALAFLGDLQRHSGIAVPDAVLAGLARGITLEKRAEWGARKIEPERRSVWQQRRVERLDLQFHRNTPPLGVPIPREMVLRQLPLGRLTISVLWHLLRRRLVRSAPTDIQFLEGFSAPEMHGCWSTGHWSAIAIPLSDSQKGGGIVRLNTSAYLGSGYRAKIVANGGGRTAVGVQSRTDDPLIAIEVMPLPELDGAGLILFWLPNACSPRRAGQSNDGRKLGLLIRREWQRL